MVGNPLIVKFIESNINQIIYQLKTNPKKGAESIVGLANRFAKNPTQKDLAQTLEKTLKNTNSPYGEILHSLVNTVNSTTFKTFIINIAHNSWSYGGKKIKQYKGAYHYNIPWTITFDFMIKTDNQLTNDHILHIIEQGKRLGIYTYLFFTDTINNLSVIAKQNPDCAFILYIPPKILTTQNIRQIKSHHNIFFSLLYEPGTNTQTIKNASSLLQSHSCLFGIHTYYTNENIPYILSNKFINELPALLTPFAFLIQSQNCTQANATKIYDYVHHSRLNQTHSLLLIDLYQDIATIDQQLSTGSHQLKIISSGDILFNQSNTHQNIMTTSLLDIVSPNSK